MSTSTLQTWNYPDRHPAISGPWDGEPDKAQWVDEATGLDCLMVRGPMGALCGYAGVPSSHPWHGKGYSECLESCGEDWCYEHTPDGQISVHGGITFANGCDDSPGEGLKICHIPAPGRPDDVWWFGFDCAHAGDVSPGLLRYGSFGGETYRDFTYVQAECAHLAEQLLAAAGGEGGG